MSTETLPNFAGYTIANRYELVKELGQGGFGAVYKAIDHGVAVSSDDRHVAVKIVQKTGSSEAKLAVLEREIIFHGLAAACSRNVVQFIDVIEDDAWCFMILELCRGGDLFDQTTEKIYQGNDELLRRAFVSLVDAVEALHEAQIAHRDLKPENVLTNEDGSQLYLGDFGLATDQPVVSDFGWGTDEYTSPGASLFSLFSSQSTVLTMSLQSALVN